MSEVAPVTLREIDRYLAATGTSDRRFGCLALNDPAFVAGMRAGREPNRKTRRKLRAFLVAEQERLNLRLDGTDIRIGHNPVSPAIVAEALRIAGELGASGNSRRVLAAIIEAALVGNFCPSNKSFCEILSGVSLGVPPQYLHDLERAGLISVTRFQTGREVYIPALGISTAKHTGARSPHWRSPAPARTRHHHTPRNHGEGDGVGELGVGRLHNDRSQ